MAETMVTWNQLQAKMAFERKIIVYGEAERDKLEFLLQQFVFSKTAYRELVSFADTPQQVSHALQQLLTQAVEPVVEPEQVLDAS